jgi:hypothetical protein
MMPWALVFAADIVSGLGAPAKKRRMKEMLGDLLADAEALDGFGEWLRWRTLDCLMVVWNGCG